MTPRPQDLPILLPILEESSISSNYSERSEGIELGQFVNHGTKRSGETVCHDGELACGKGIASMLSTTTADSLIAMNHFRREISGCEIGSNNVLLENEKAQKNAQGRCLQSAISPLAEISLEFKETDNAHGAGDVELPLARNSTTRSTTPVAAQAKEIIRVPMIEWKDCNGPWKNILVMGDSERDKSWTLSTLVNFLMGVEFNDPFRYHVVSDERSKSQDVRAFSFFPLHSDVSYGVTIIDTPVFGESATTGIQDDDDDIWNTIKDFCEKNLSKLDAVCFMVHSSCTHLTKQQYHLYEKVSNFLGQYALEKIFMACSGCDTKQPLSMSTIHRIDDVRIKRRLVLNHSPSLCSNHSQQDGVDRVKDDYNTTADNRFDLPSRAHWDNDCKALKQFFAHDLCKVPPTLLQKRKRIVSTEHESLKNVIVSINNQIRIGLDTLECIRRTVCTLAQHQKDLDANAELKLKVPRTRFCKVDLSTEGAFTTTCLLCNFACCDPCRFSNECGTIDSLGHCQVCPGKCTWEMHKNVPYLVKHATDLVEEALLEDDEVAEAVVSGMSHTEAILRKHRALYIVTKTQILRDLDIVRNSLNHLSQKNPRYETFDPDYHVQRMIHAEIKRGDTGFRGRVQALRTMLEQAQYLREAEGTESPRQLDNMDTVLMRIDREVEKCSRQSRKSAEKTHIIMGFPRLFGSALGGH